MTTQNTTPNKSYINFIEIPYTGKTKRVEIRNKTGILLGEIRWASGWRRYCFFPESLTQFDVTCLFEIYHKIADLMADRYEERHPDA